MRDFWKKFLAGFFVTLAMAGGVRAGGTGPTVFEPFIWTNAGSAAAPSHSFVNDSDTGIFNPTPDQVGMSIGGTSRYLWNALSLLLQRSDGSIILSNGGQYAWSSGTAGVAGADLILARDAANTLAQRNGANAQSFRVYNTYTDASNYERILFGWSGTNAFLVTESAGTGTARDLVVGTSGAANLNFRSDNTNRWRVQTSTGAFVAIADNTYDIGASGATRPRNIYVGSAIVAGTTIKTNGYTVGTLPACNAGAAGTRAYVTDAAAPAFLTALAGGGAVVSPAFCDGTNWIAG